MVLGTCGNPRPCTRISNFAFKIGVESPVDTAESKPPNVEETEVIRSAFGDIADLEADNDVLDALGERSTYGAHKPELYSCLLYTSDAADE